MTEQIISPIEAIEEVVVIKKADFKVLQEKAERLDRFIDLNYWEHPSKIYLLFSQIIVRVTTDQQWGNDNHNSQGRFGDQIDKFHQGLTNLLFPNDRFLP